MKEYRGYVYIVTNKVNGKKYIGRHYRSRDDTDILNDGYLGSGGLHYKNARVKYGDENFVKEILDEGPYTLEEAIEREKYWISYYNAVEDPMFYNECLDSNPPLLIGDRNPARKSPPTLGKKMVHKCGVERYVVVSDIEKYISEGWSLGRCPESIEKMRLNRPDFSGSKNPFYGKKHTKTSIEKITSARNSQENLTLDNMRGKVWINNGLIEMTILEETLEEYPRDIWSRGRLPMQSSTKSKIRSARMSQENLNLIGMKGKVWVHNESQELAITEEEISSYESSGWSRGRLCEGEWRKYWIHKDGKSLMVLGKDLDHYLELGFKKGRK